MKRLMLLILPLLFGWTALAEPLAGILEKTPAGIYLTLTTTAKKFLITVTSGDATEGLKKLETGDFITGSGSFDREMKTLRLDSLDYVGLKKLLGLWYSGDNVMNFSSFSNLSVYPLFSYGGSAAPDILLKADFRYSTAPLAGKGWAVFLSSKASTVFATIEFSSNPNSGLGSDSAPADFATLRTYNGDTGNADRTIRLIRWSK